MHVHDDWPAEVLYVLATVGPLKYLRQLAAEVPATVGPLRYPRQWPAEVPATTVTATHQLGMRLAFAVFLHLGYEYLCHDEILDTHDTSEAMSWYFKPLAVGPDVPASRHGIGCPHQKSPIQPKPTTAAASGASLTDVSPGKSRFLPQITRSSMPDVLLQEFRL